MKDQLKIKDVEPISLENIYREIFIVINMWNN